MSINRRNRFPSHKHFQSDVLQARDQRPLRPSSRGTHATDVIIDSVLTLDESVVEYTRRYEANKFSLLSPTIEVDDSTATEGKCIKRVSANPTGDMWSAASEIIGSGDFYYLFMLKVPSISSSSDIATLYVGTGTVTKGSRTIKPNEFPAANKWVRFAVKASDLKADEAVYPVVNFKTGVTDLYVDWIGVVPGNVPLGDTDIDTDSHSGTDTDAHGGTNTDAHGGTTAASGYMPWELALTNDFGSEVEVKGDAMYTIREGTCSTITDAIDLALISFRLQRGASGGDALFMCRVLTDNTIEGDYLVKLNANLTLFYLKILVPRNCSGKTVKIWGKTDGTATVWVQGAIDVFQFKKHSHTMTNPNNHSVTQPSNHTVTDPINHVITNPPHEH